MPTPDILCLGEPLVEFNRRPDGLWLGGHGGDSSNCAVAAARQGASVGYLSRVGDDPFGHDLLDLWRAEGVDTTGVRVDPQAPTGVYFVTHGPEGHVFTYRRAGSAASLMTPADLAVEALRGTRLLHVSGIGLAISDSAAETVFAAIETAREAGGRVSCDPNLRLKLWGLGRGGLDRAREVIHAAMARCQIALPGLEDAVRLTGLSDPDAIADVYLGLGAEVVALTLGAEGALVATPDARTRLPGHRVEAVDATGAGDAFDGAFLAALAEGADPFAAGRRANAAAALSVTGQGAVAPLPSRAQVEAFLAAREG